MRFNTETRGYLKCKISLGLHERGGRTYGRTEDFLKTKISCMHRYGNQIFLPVALRCECCARESSAISHSYWM